jgi:endonuclease/exonuclease/phosphatase family metal-dependent hydrolase
MGVCRDCAKGIGGLRILARTMPTLLLTATLASAASAPLSGEPLSSPESVPASCRDLVDERGNRPGADTVVTWTVRPEPHQRRRLDLQCKTLGPIVVQAAPAGHTTVAARPLVVIGWNVHVGGGDIEQILDRLTTGQLDGAAGSDYALLIEEAYRAGGLVPVALEAGVRVPRGITPRPREHVRADIVSIARRRGLALYYVPSMRNGHGPPYEDRGNAILSTLPLGDLTAIELPIDRQRRVAISATVRGLDEQNRPWRLRLVTVHLDAFVGAKRLWIFATAWRGHQARTVLATLNESEPTVVGADLNTWLGGRWESAYRRFASVPSASPVEETVAGGRLDFIFFRLAPGWTGGSRRLDRHFGSDHRPIVGVVRYP